MSPDSEELKERIANLTDEQLLEMISAEPGEYREEAITYAKNELKWRGVDYSAPPAKPASEQEAEDPDKVVAGVSRCLLCDGTLRPGVLMGEKELTVIFADNKEERFVKVSACTECGHIALFVDKTTDVQL